MKKIFYSCIVVFWLVMTALFLSGHSGSNRNAENTAHKSAASGNFYGEQWMGVYYKGEKIGYAVRDFEKTDKGYRISERLKMRLNVMNTGKEIETTTDAYMNPDFRLDSFDLVFGSDASMKVRGRIEGKSLKVSMDASGVISEKTIPLKDIPSINISMIPEILKEGINPGKKFSMAIIDPMTLSSQSRNDQERTDIEVEGKEQIVSSGVKQDAIKLKGSLKGMEFFIWLSEKGEVLKEESPMGFTLVREPREIAMQIGKPSPDIIKQVAVPFNLKLTHDVSYLRVRISGIDFKGLDLDGGRQSLKGDVLAIRKEDLKNVSEGKGGKVEEYLKDTMFIQSKDPKIVSLSREIVKNEKDMLKQTELIYEWVYRNIEKVSAITIPTSTEVLKAKRGDCNEHATLYAALARAAGIPTTIAIGLVYMDGYFYYHAWPEVYINQWIAIDPTLGEFPADAAHIRLITGDMDKQAQILSVIGKIKIEGLEYR